jgi:flagella basal body P-ring formation protein FlgA
MLISARAILHAVAVVLALFGSRSVARAEDRVLPVPSVTIHPGDVIKEGMLTERPFTSNSLGVAMFVDARQSLLGRMARRTLLPGQPIPTNAVEDPWAVNRGAVVKVMVEDNGLSIVTYGSALQSGSAGSVIPVRNVDTGVIIRGVVQPDGTIKVVDG